MDLIVIYLCREQAALARSIVSGAAASGLTAVSTLRSQTLYWEKFESKIVLLIEPPGEGPTSSQINLRSFLRPQEACKVFYAPEKMSSPSDKTACYFLGCDMVFDSSVSIIELIERLKARAGDESMSIRHGLTYLPWARVIKSAGGHIELTIKENLVFKLIATTTGYVGTQAIQEIIAGQSGATVTSSAVTIHSLRKKLQNLQPRLTIVSRGGLGYNLY